MNLTRDAILGYEDSDLGSIEIKEFGGAVYVALLTAEEADQIRTLGEKGMPTNVELVILGACDENGKRLFKKGDGAALAKKPARLLTKIANKVLEHNGFGEGAADEAKNA